MLMLMPQQYSADKGQLWEQHSQVVSELLLWCQASIPKAGCCLLLRIGMETACKQATPAKIVVYHVKHAEGAAPTCGCKQCRHGKRCICHELQQ